MRFLVLLLPLGLLRRFVLIALIIMTSLSLSPNVKAFSALANPSQGVTGALVIVSGKDWPPNDSVDISWPSTTWPNTTGVQTVPTDGNGSFAVTIAAPRDAPQGPNDINVFNKKGVPPTSIPLLTAAPFTVIKSEPVACIDAYFIGVHGTGEGPDTAGNNQTVSNTIGETWEHFYDVAKSMNKIVRGYALDYSGPPWQVLAGAVPLVGAADQGMNKLDALFVKTQSLCSNYVVLAGYSLGAWVIDKWLAANLSPPFANVFVSTSIRAVELYGDPLWLHDVYGGIERRLGQTVTLDPYTNTPPGYKGSLVDRWQSLCLANDPICGEGYPLTELSKQAIDTTIKCTQFCEHWKYALSPGLGLVGYGSTKGGGEFLASEAFK